jgi:hypothetical protein
MRISICAAAFLLFVGTTGALAQDASGIACPVRIKSARLSPVIGGNTVMYGKAPVQRKLSFHYENLSGKDIESISLRITGRLQVSGPAGSSFLDTAKPVVVQGPMNAGKSGKKSIKLTTLPDVPIKIVLTEVKFADRSAWANDAGLSCASSIY